MVSFTALALAFTAAVGALSIPADFLEARDDGNSTEVLEKRQSVGPGTGYNHGYYYSYWTDGGGSVQYSMQSGSEYRVSWQNVGNFIAGKGHVGVSIHAQSTINYGGYFSVLGNGYLSVYGWTHDPLVEYYVVENFGTYNPSSGAQYKGSFQTDGATYNVYQSTRYNQPSIEGTRTFNQYWSVRQSKRSEGTVTMQNHFNTWSRYGMYLGSHDYQIVATEGYQSSGSADIYVQTH